MTSTHSNLLSRAVQDVWTHSRLDRLTYAEGTTATFIQSDDRYEVVVRIPDDQPRYQHEARRRIYPSALVSSSARLVEVLDRAVYDAATELYDRDPWVFWSP